MRKLAGVLCALALVTISTLGSGLAYAQGATEGQLIRIFHLDTWHPIPIDITVKTFTIVPPFYYGVEGPFVGRAEVLFTGEAASYFEPGVDRYELGLSSDTVLYPGSRLHLEGIDRSALPSCANLSQPTQETCLAGNFIFRTVVVTNR